MQTEPVTPLQVNSLRTFIGIGAAIVDFGNVDYTKGRGILEGLDRCLWTKKGYRITIHVMEHGGIIVSQSREIDPDLPPSVYPGINTNLYKCIKPECDIMVDRNKRKSGACCKEHMSYECTHIDCVLRAQTNNWKRPTHPYGTKIARQHLQWRKEAV